jgi:septal ring factor EnvC (AmiA/AmiB activator)
VQEAKCASELAAMKAIQEGLEADIKSMRDTCAEIEGNLREATKREVRVDAQLASSSTP